MAVAAAVLFGIGLALPSRAVALPIGWICTGNCGTLGADGVVTAPPGGGTYEFVSTNGAPSSAGLGLGFNETNGSILTTDLFAASGVEQLVFNFNYVTSDGSGFPEYAWAALVPDVGSPLLLFTARTCEVAACDTVPGVGMPALGAGVTLNPATTPIIGGAPSWSPLGGSSGRCWDIGCGYTGWIEALYTPAAGNYSLQFGVVNVNDEAYDSGMAIAGVKIGDEPVDDPIDDQVPVPEPSTLMLLGVGLAGVAGRLRARRVV